MHILENEKIWFFFRRTLDLLFGLYRKRIKVIKSFDLDKNISIIDIGCGTGEFSKITSSQYLGIDLDANYIKQAQKIYAKKSNKKFICENLNNLDSSNTKFDLALLIDLTHHINNRELSQLFKKLNQIARYIIICDPVKQSAGNSIGRFLTSMDRGHFIRPKEELINLVKNNFVIIKSKPTRIIGIEGICILAKINYS